MSQIVLQSIYFGVFFQHENCRFADGKVSAVTFGTGTGGTLAGKHGS